MGIWDTITDAAKKVADVVVDAVEAVIDYVAELLGFDEAEEDCKEEFPDDRDPGDPKQPCPKKEKPKEPVHQIDIVADKASYVVVIKKGSPGDPWSGYPVLKFNLSKGTAGQKVDVQVSRDTTAAGLTGGPGLAASWKSTQSRTVRAGKKIFSSWSNGNTITLDAKGEATYEMPKEWWRDLARIPLSQFTTIKLHYRAVAVAGSKITARSSADGSGKQVPIHNNLTAFDVVEHGYINRGLNYSVTMKFTVREADTTKMYTMINWNKGSNRVWGGGRTYAVATDYGISHRINIPEWAIDRLRTNPRYADGVYTISSDKKTASTTDTPGGGIGSSDTHDFYALDFDTRVHLNFDVPSSVKITRKEGSAPIYGIVIGKLDNPQPVTLASDTWETRILQVKGRGGTVTTTHPNTYGGP